MKIIQCDQENAETWDAFLNKQESASFYHLFAWKNINESCFRHKTYYLAASEKDEFIGVLPLIYINSIFFGKILCSMPFLNYGGIYATAHSVESALLNEAREIVAKEKIGYLELRNMQKLTEPLPTSEQKISMTLKLDQDPDVIWNNLKSKQRTEIRRSYKNELEVVSGGKELLNIFFPVLAESWRSLGTPIYQKDYFRTILDTFPDNTRIFIVYHRDTPIAAAFNGYYQGTVEGMWLGIIPQFRKLYPNYALYWEMIKHACENKYKTFHFGRSSVDSGGEFFKKKWNANAKQLYWQYYLGTVNDMPQLNVHNPKYKLAIKLWKKIPLGLTTFIGPKIARGIP